MSVCMNLYKIVDGVEYLGKPEDKVKWSVENPENLEKIEVSLGYREDFTFEEMCDWQDKVDAQAWSDGVNHDMIDLVQIREMHKVGKSNKLDRCFKQTLDKLKNYTFKSFKNENGQNYKYIAVDSVVYRQGWFLRKRFFNRKSWYFIATTKEQMEKFFDRYLDKSIKASDVRKAFNDDWVDGMIFECTW